MSGGHYDYQYHQVSQLADYIERDMLADFKRNSYEGEQFDMIDAAGASPYQRLQVMAEIRWLVHTLRNAGNRARELDLMFSGDTSANTYLERLEKIKQQYPTNLADL